jgi:serralysin
MMIRIFAAISLAAGLLIPQAQASERFVSPTGAGTKDGSSLGNAARIDKIDEQIAAAGPGGRVLLRTDRGAYGKQYIAIRSGGGASAPVTISGVDGQGKSSVVNVIGTGKPYFQLYEGADHLVFDGWDVKKVGQGWIQVNGPVTDLTVQNVHASDIRQLIDVNKNGSIDGFLMKNLKADSFSKAFLGLSNATNGRIESSVLDSDRHDGDPIPMGVHIEGASHDIVVSGVTVRNIFNSAKGDPTKYWNGDGFATEGGTSGIRFEDCHVDGASDAGFDLKGGTPDKPQVVVKSSVTNVKRGLRVWGVVHTDGLRIGKLVMPSVTNPDGTVVSQASEAGGRAAVWLHGGASLKQRGIEQDSSAPVKFDQSEGTSTVEQLN